MTDGKLHIQIIPYNIGSTNLTVFGIIVTAFKDGICNCAQLYEHSQKHPVPKTVSERYSVSVQVTVEPHRASDKQWTQYSWHCATLHFFMVALWNRETIYIFMLWFVLSSSFFFFPRLISATADWMFAILPHMVWPQCEFKMQVWNLLHAARWKHRTQKSRQKSPSGHLRTTLSGYIFATKARIDNRKKTC